MAFVHRSKAVRFGLNGSAGDSCEEAQPFSTAVGRGRRVRVIVLRHDPTVRGVPTRSDLTRMQHKLAAVHDREIQHNMRRLPPLHAIEAFLQVARLGTLSAASDALGLSSSAVTRRIHVLERFIGRKLFDPITEKACT